MSKGFQEGEWEFTFPNGDKYTGQYCAHVSGLAWRQGRGVYLTHDGQSYEGNWKDDKLNETENLEITFQNHDHYNGKIVKYKYNGPATYSFKNGGRLSCNFANNKPSGDVIYIDHHDQLWYGKAEPESVLLAREHVFSYELDSERGKGRPKRKLLQTTDGEDHEIEKISAEESVDMKELERLIFAKSFKTGADINFDDSEWIKDHQKFAEMRKAVLSKINASGASSLNLVEKSWYKRYWKSGKIVQARKYKKDKKIHHDLLKQHFDEELKDTCPPISVFYPAQFGEQAFGE